MSDPSLIILLEVEFLEWVQFSGASSHHMAVSRDGISHVEVVNVLTKLSVIQVGVSIWFVGEVFEARTFDHIVLDEMRGEFGKSCSELLDGIVW